jgi:hypothetical protein
MSKQTSLFERELQAQPEPPGLVLVSQPDRAPTKGQRRFNRLVARVEELRIRLDSEIRRLDEALAYYGAHLHPRIQRQNALRTDIVRALAPFLQKMRLKRKTDRAILKMIIAEQLAEIVQQGGSIEDDLRAIFERVHGVDYERAAEQEMEEVRSVMEDMLSDFGIDMDFSDFRPDMTEAELAAKAAEMAERMQQKAKEEDRESEPSNRRPTKRQLEKEHRMRQAEEARKKTIGSIYKQLARVLHPDLEPDAEARQRKVTLMQELTVAYRNKDLHTLLRLELEWIQREEGILQRLTDEKLAIYNDVLKEQVDELESELQELPFRPRYQALVVPDGPFEARLRINGPAEAQRLDRMIASMEESLARMQSTQALAEVHAAIQAYRAAHRDPYGGQRSLHGSSYSVEW